MKDELKAVSSVDEMAARSVASRARTTVGVKDCSTAGGKAEKTVGSTVG